jgi:hypothetical protein
LLPPNDKLQTQSVCEFTDIITLGTALQSVVLFPIGAPHLDQFALKVLDSILRVLRCLFLPLPTGVRKFDKKGVYFAPLSTSVEIMQNYLYKITFTTCHYHLLPHPSQFNILEPGQCHWKQSAAEQIQQQWLFIGSPQ